MRRCYEKLREKNVCSLQGISAATANKQPPVERNRPNSGVNHREFTSDRSWFGEKEKKKKKEKLDDLRGNILFTSSGLTGQ